MDANKEKILGKFYEPELVNLHPAMNLHKAYYQTPQWIFFRENTMASFRNQLSQPIQLQGQWKVGLTSISFPSNINNVNSTEIMVYDNSGSQIYASHHRMGQLRKIRKSIYKSWEHLVQETIRVAHLTQFDYKFDFVTGKLIFTFGKNEGLSFQGDEIPSILVFKAKPDPTNEGFFHIGYKSEKLNNRDTGVFPVDITCGSQLF